MLSRDTELGRNLNLMSSKHDNVPQDFYGLLMNKITEKLSLNMEKVGKEGACTEAFKRILDFEPGRSFIKKSVMINAYNATTPIMNDGLKDACICIYEPDFSDELEYDASKRQEMYKSRRYILKDSTDHTKYLLEDDFDISRYRSISSSIYTIHDCYAVPISHVGSVINLLQAVYL